MTVSFASMTQTPMSFLDGYLFNTNVIEALAAETMVTLDGNITAAPVPDFILRMNGDDHGNTFADATFISATQDLPARLETADDIDMFQIAFTDGDIWSFTVPEAGVSVKLFDEDGFETDFTSQFTVTATGVRTFFLANIGSGFNNALADGDYFIRITDGFQGLYYQGGPADTIGTYNLNTTYVIDDYGNTEAAATEVTEGDVINGRVEEAFDQDMFYVDVAVGDAITFTSSSVNNAVDFKLYNEFGDLVGDIPSGTYEATFLQEGRYFIRADYFDIFNVGNYPVDYSFSWVSTRTVTVPGEIGSTVATAQALSETLISDIDFIWDRDMFAVLVEAGDIGQFDLVGLGAEDMELTLLRADGTVLANNDDYFGPGGETLGTYDSRINYTFDTGGTYYLRVNASDTDLGDYQISADITPALIDQIGMVVNAREDDNHFTFAAPAVSTFIDGGAGTDTLDFSAYDFALWADLAAGGMNIYARGGDTVTTGTWTALANLTNIERIVTTAFQDVVFGDGSDNVFGFVDVQAGSGFFDRFDGRDGTDIVSFDSYDQAVWVDMAYNGIEAWTRGGDSVLSGVWDTLANFVSIEGVRASGFQDQIFGDGGDNTVYFTDNAGAFNSFDRYDGRGGSDTVDFSSSHQAIWVNLVYGGVEAYGRGGTTVDTGTWEMLANLDNFENINGSRFDDKIWGTAADNVINAGQGNDMMTGYAGADIFIFDTDLIGAVGIPVDERNLITDFETGTDKIDLTAYDINFDNLLIYDVFDGSGAVVQYVGIRIDLANVMSADLSADDFLF